MTLDFCVTNLFSSSPFVVAYLKMNRISEDKENKIEPQDSFEEDYESTIPPVVNRQLGHGCIDKIVFKNFL